MTAKCVQMVFELLRATSVASTAKPLNYTQLQLCVQSEMAIALADKDFDTICYAQAFDSIQAHMEARFGLASLHDQWVAATASAAAPPA